jgi:DinB family protein
VVSIPAPLAPFLTPERAGELAHAGLYADDLDGLRTANANLRALWDATIERARRLDPAQLDERVGGEWSFIETLRHLVFVTDVWVGRVIEGREDANHPWGMPPDHVPREAVAALGITIDARPTVDEVLTVLDQRGQLVDRVLAELTPDGLSRRCTMPQGEIELVGALQVVLYEGLCHNSFATRDLASLEADPST